VSGRVTRGEALQVAASGSGWHERNRGCTGEVHEAGRKSVGRWLSVWLYVCLDLGAGEIYDGNTTESQSNAANKLGRLKPDGLACRRQLSNDKS